MSERLGAGRYREQGARTSIGAAGALLLVAVVGLQLSAPPSGSVPATGTRAHPARPGAVPEIPAGPDGGSGGQTQGGSGVLTSVNWSGYADTGTTFSAVRGDWVQPTATCPEDKPQQAAFWVGIGGFVEGDPDIEQIGTDSDCLKVKGKDTGEPNYYAWFQMSPQSLVVLPTSSYAVSPGQSIEASVTVSAPNRYTLAITDIGHWSFSTPESQATQPEDASAEWITEAPSSCNSSGKCKVLPLADFGSVAMTDGMTDDESVSGPGLAVHEIEMTSKNAKTVKAAPSSLADSGTSFTVTWESN
ncbi:MAG TPA: G1 family glutamic endopeptidase [Acidimicrobiales bacterium]|nr:G1 family glutamic endopeptidase [Acidimicrobiales bacterium]